jgi:hypothetical protein
MRAWRREALPLAVMVHLQEGLQVEVMLAE